MRDVGVIVELVVGTGIATALFMAAVFWSVMQSGFIATDRRTDLEKSVDFAKVAGLAFVLPLVLARHAGYAYAAGAIGVAAAVFAALYARNAMYHPKPHDFPQDD